MKCALVTGGSRGIGSAICQKLAADSDYHILINYQSNREAAEDTLQKVIANGATGELIKFNVADADEVKSVLTAWQDNNPDAVVEVIVNNAGITKDGLFMWMSQEDWSQVINTSLNGFYNVTGFFIQKLLRN
jgi:3-oxoacyl-[acyl-carrier protein] reductase